MADIVNNENVQERKTVLNLAELIKDHKGEDTVALYIGDISGWTDYFIITTVQSTGHLRGLIRIVQEFLADRNIEPYHRYKNADVTDEGWVLIDCGSFIVHLMRKETREFYELERLWFSGVPVYGGV